MALTPDFSFVMLSYTQDLLLAEAAKTLILKSSAPLPSAVAANPSSTQDTDTPLYTYSRTSVKEPKQKGLEGRVADQREKQNKFHKGGIFTENFLSAATPSPPPIIGNILLVSASKELISLVSGLCTVRNF